MHALLAQTNAPWWGAGLFKVAGGVFGSFATDRLNARSEANRQRQEREDARREVVARFVTESERYYSAVVDFEPPWTAWRLFRLELHESDSRRMEPFQSQTSRSHTPPSAATRLSFGRGRPVWSSKSTPVASATER